MSSTTYIYSYYMKYHNLFFLILDIFVDTICNALIKYPNYIIYILK